MPDVYRRGHNKEIETIVSEVGKVLDSVKNSSELSEKLNGENGLFSKLYEYRPISVYQGILKDRALNAIQVKKQELKKQESPEHQNWAPKIGQD